MNLDEIRVKSYITIPLDRGEAQTFPKWATLGWNKKTPLVCFAGCFTFEIKLKNDPLIYKGVASIDFLSDRGSVPRFIPDSIADDGGTFWELIAYYVHDFLYKNQTIKRKLADEILRDIRLLSGSSKFKTGIIYRAVRLGGGVPWRSYADYTADISQNHLKITYPPKFTLSGESIRILKK